MDQNTIALLQVIAALVQGFAALAVIPITFYAALKGADRGAQKAYELNELAAQDRERREQAKQRKQIQEQISSLRLLLSLEIRQNLKGLEWLRNNLVEMLGDEKEQYYKRRGIPIESDEAYQWFELRQRFISSYMPDWSHRFWYGQQSSHMLPVALQEKEIRQINFIHSQLDRLSEIRDMLAESARRYDKGQDPALPADLSGSSMRSLSFKEDAPRLWDEFMVIVNEILDEGNPLADSLKESDPGNASKIEGGSNAVYTLPQAGHYTDSLKLNQ